MSHQLTKMATPAATAFVDRLLAATVAEALDKALLVRRRERLAVSNAAGIDSRSGTSFAWSDACSMLAVADSYAQANASPGWPAGRLQRGRHAAGPRPCHRWRVRNRGQHPPPVVRS
jgi:hypothetical protein